MAIMEHIQEIISNYPKDIEVLLATIVSISPLKISIVGDEKRTPSQDSIIISESLTKRKVLLDLNLKEPALMDSGGTYQINPGQFHECFIDNSLKIGDICICISYSMGQRYILLNKLGG